MLLIDCCNNGAFEINLNESNIEKGLIKFRGKFQEAEAVNKNKRMYPFAVLDENVQRLQEVVKSRGLVGELDHPCLIDSNFEVLTPEGWKSFKEIRVGDDVFSLKQGQMIVSKVQGIVDEPYDGKAYQIKGRSINCTFTSPHKFILNDRNGEEFYTTIDEIHKNRTQYSHCLIPKTAKWEGSNQQYFTISSTKRLRLSYAEKELKIDTEKFVTFLGIYLAEGNLKKDNRIEISQKTSYGKKIIRKFLNDFHEEIKWKEFKNGFYTKDARLYDYLVPLGNKYSKYIPEKVKSLAPQYLEKLVVAFAIGDGRILDCKNKSAFNLKKKDINLSLDKGKFSRLSVFSVSKQLIDDLHECIVKSGWAANYHTVTDHKDYQFAGRLIEASNKKPLHCLNLSRAKGIYLDTRFLSTIEKHHTGSIYCLKTDHGNFYMRYRGKSFWTGNCDSIIHFKEASHVITNLYWDGNKLMGEGEILNTAHGRQLKALLQDGVRVGISSRGVGNGKVNENGILVIGESYKLITFDAVADPSTFAAFQEKVTSKKEAYESEEPPHNQNNSEETIKNEVSRIHISKEAVIAALGGIFREQTNGIKARL